MITASELAGYFAAHTVWCLSDADSFNPVLAYTTEDGQRHMQRLIGQETEAAVEFGRQRLADNPMDANDAALLFDGRIPGASGKLDAIIIELRCYAFPWAEATIAVPYTPRGRGGSGSTGRSCCAGTTATTSTSTRRSRLSSAGWRRTRRARGCGMPPWMRVGDRGHTKRCR